MSPQSTGLPWAVTGAVPAKSFGTVGMLTKSGGTGNMLTKSDGIFMC